ncbi:MAG: phosphoenolpyruvate--protein phosphotransferase [Cobetia sp.]|jgi:phosphotransferase system enzyme I (PtsP)|uniref:phosphoenolpyruvate--protein phosphotransferase n=2 Tax=Halomonadaceae TaxID=28256 RepID=UPI000C5B5B87|nr:MULTISPECIES: phosphoenolpyruvate--protein phosphotransferase [Cobetia]MBK10732.1 phosphoenolpyruvate--protein phosphotransferase [Cobetia sp.]MDH2296924.1 phosphoenolpyruvate--protein phosphotransferase [Cobetia sp. 29-18-1]UBU47999.1 phosphoenolpyruvate--protein phosphotransferase [Cobetia amphilecti]|tara:strand:- start:53284 stop:55584 length:2301 start_codon:yes stop_codon:yes gene_type:complete
MLEVLRRIVQEVNGARSLDAALATMVLRIRKAMKTDVCSVYLLAPESDRFVLKDTIGLRSSSVGQVSLARGEGLVGMVALREEPLNLEDAPAHPQFRYFEETGEERFSSFLGVPIIHQRRVLGVLVIQQHEKRRFDEGEEAFLVTLGAQLAGVLAHALATGALGKLAGTSGQATFSGVAGSPGIAIGKAFVLSPPADLDAVPDLIPTDIEFEIARLKEAINAVREEIRVAAERLASRISTQEHALFEVYQQMLGDAALGQEVEKRIREGQWAPAALADIVRRHVQYLERVDDDYLRERAADIRDLGRRVLSHLQEEGDSGPIEYPENTILIGHEISPATLGEVPRERLKGLVAVSGSSTSHVAILARAMGIPTVLGMVDLPLSRLGGAPVILDGHRGRLVVRPELELGAYYSRLIEEEQALSALLEQEQDLPSVTPDGHVLPLMVNTGLALDSVASLKSRVGGVGLYRTEVPFMMSDRFPSEQEQARLYREQLLGFAPLPVTMRTLDIGGDKDLPYFPINEANPFLGWRGIRVTLDHPEVLMVQLRAMLRAAEGLDNLRIMLPMISGIEEVDAALALVNRALVELAEEGINVSRPSVGVMIEVPAALYQLEALATRVDFFSVGSNDLTQYLLAVDRNNPRVASLYDACHPAVLRALARLAEESRALKMPVSVCGELAGDPAGALLLLGMGFDSLSMNAPSLPRVRAAIRRVSLSAAQGLVGEVLCQPTADEVHDLLLHRLQAWDLAHLLPPRDNAPVAQKAGETAS